MALNELNKTLDRLVWLMIVIGIPLAALLGFAARGTEYLPAWWSNARLLCGAFLMIRFCARIGLYSNENTARVVREVLVGGLLLHLPGAVFAILELYDHPFWNRPAEVFGPEDLAQRLGGLGDPLCEGVMVFIFIWPVAAFLLKAARARLKPKTVE
jgi:hypothetical protein